MRPWLAAGLIWSIGLGAALADVKTDLEGALAAFFDSDVTVDTYEFLREGPTVTGIAFPKYYLWVHGVNAGVAFRGAVRVVDQNGTIVATQFLSDAEIRGQQGSVGTVFPAPLVPAIIERAAAGK